MMNIIVGNVLTVVLIILALLLLICMFMAVKGPRVADRVVCVNMMGTIVIVMIGILAVKLKEGYLADICILYAMISFLAVIILTKTYMGVYLEKRANNAEKENQKEDVEGVNNQYRYNSTWADFASPRPFGFYF